MAELGAPPACGGKQRHPKLRRVRRLCVWSLVIGAVVIVLVNLTMARLPTMPPADGKYISLRGINSKRSTAPGRLPPSQGDTDPPTPSSPSSRGCDYADPETAITPPGNTFHRRSAQRRGRHDRGYAMSA
jgi:hypothetical protein